MLDRAEILRYLGASGRNSVLDKLIERAEAEVIQAAHPRHVYKRISLQVDMDTASVQLASRVLVSRDLAKHLHGCNEGFLFACTLGAEVDSLVKRYSLIDVPMLPVVQAVAGTYIEFYANQAQKELEIYGAEHGLFLRPRYSPGYGDFQLECQRILFDILEIPKKIGVSLTDSFLMVPFKSITAVIGLSADPSLCHVNKCMTCTAMNCPFRKEIPIE